MNTVLSLLWLVIIWPQTSVLVSHRHSLKDGDVMRDIASASVGNVFLYTSFSLWMMHGPCTTTHTQTSKQTGTVEAAGPQQKISYFHKVTLCR